MNGILIVNKPQGFTSFDAVALVRKATGQRKVGHCGTLDPNATGVLPVLLGSATKAQDILPNHNKEYFAELKFGIETDTLDIWGKVLKSQPSRVTAEDFEKALCAFRGDIMQVPPMYSALKQNGKRLYDLAREGIEVKREPRPVTVYSLTALSFSEKEQNAAISVSCSKGTYIRSLISDIGKAVGTGAVMTSLQRSSACGYTLSQALNITELSSLSPIEIEKNLMPTESLFEAYPCVSVSRLQATRFTNGGALDLARLHSLPVGICADDILRVKHENRFLGLGKICDSQLKIFKLFNL